MAAPTRPVARFTGIDVAMRGVQQERFGSIRRREDRIRGSGELHGSVGSVAREGLQCELRRTGVHDRDGRGQRRAERDDRLGTSAHQVDATTGEGDDEHRGHQDRSPWAPRLSGVDGKWRDRGRDERWRLGAATERAWSRRRNVRRGRRRWWDRRRHGCRVPVGDRGLANPNLPSAPGSNSGCRGAWPSSSIDHDANGGLVPPIGDIQIVAASYRGRGRQLGGGAGGAAVAGGGATGAAGVNETVGAWRSASATWKKANGWKCMIWP